MAGYQTYQKLHYSSSMLADDSEFGSHIIEKIVEARDSSNVMDTDLVYTGIDCQWPRHAVNGMEKTSMLVSGHLNSGRLCLTDLSVSSKTYNIHTKALSIKVMKSALTTQIKPGSIWPGADGKDKGS